MAQTETVQIPIEILDKATVRAKEIQAGMDRVSKAAKDAGVSQSAFNQALKESTASAEKQKFSFTELNSVIGLAKQGIQALKQVYDFAEMGAQNQRLMDSGRELASSFGANMDTIIDKLDEASLGAVDKLSLVGAANRSMMLNVTSDADEMANLMQVAAFRARAMGLDTTQAFNDIVTGIGRNSPLILDNLGIITKGWAEEAKAAGVAYDQHFILNKVLEQGNAQLREAGGLVADSATEYEKFKAELTNTKNGLAEMAAKGLTPALHRINEVNDAAAVLKDRLDDGTISYLEWTDLNSKLGRGLMSVEEVMNRYGNTTVEVAEDIRIAADAAADADSIFSNYRTTIANGADTISEVSKEYEAWLSLVGSISDETADYNDTLADLQAKYDDETKKLDELTKTRWWDVAAIDEQKAKLEDLKGKMAEEADAFEENSQRRVIAMLEEKFAVDGLSEAETRYLEDLRVKAGIYSVEAIEAARAAREEVDALFNSFNNLPEAKTFKMQVVTSYVNQGVPASVAQNIAGGYSEGTGGWRTVPPGFSNDTYPVMVSSGERFAVIPANESATPAPTSVGGGGESFMGMFVPAMQQMTDSFARSIRAELQKAGRK